MRFKDYLILSHLKVKGANAQSSPISVGIPSVTSFLGAAHRLERILIEKGFDSIKISGAAIVLHDAHLRTFHSVAGFECLVAEGKPLKKDGERLSTIPEPKIDMEISMILELDDPNFSIYDEDSFLNTVDETLQNNLRIAGGIILPSNVMGSTNCSYLPHHIVYKKGVDAYDSSSWKTITRKLIPGYVLLERRDLMIKEMEDGKTATEALVDYLAIHHQCSKKEDGTVEWTRRKKAEGWLVPISVGFQGLSDPQKVKNQRCDDYLHVFGENLITLGEFKMINGIKDIDEIMWKYEVDLANGLYKCICNGGK